MNAYFDSESMISDFIILLKHKIPKRYDINGFGAETLKRFRVVGTCMLAWTIMSLLSCCFIPFIIKEILSDKASYARIAFAVSLILFSFLGFITTIILMLMFKTGHCCFAKVSAFKSKYFSDTDTKRGPCYVVLMKSDVFPQDYFYYCVVKPEVYEEMKDTDIYIAYLNRSVLGFVY